MFRLCFQKFLFINFQYSILYFHWFVQLLSFAKIILFFAYRRRSPNGIGKSWLKKSDLWSGGTKNWSRFWPGSILRFTSQSFRENQEDFNSKTGFSNLRRNPETRIRMKPETGNRLKPEVNIRRVEKNLIRLPKKSLNCYKKRHYPTVQMNKK